MSTIRVIYPVVRSVNAKSQHPDAEAYVVKSDFLGHPVTVVALGGEPTPREVDSILNPPPGKSDATRIVEAMQNDPVALASLKSELSK